MVRAIDKGNGHIHAREAGVDASLEGFADAFANRLDELTGHGAADDLVNEDVAAPFSPGSATITA